MIKDKVIRLICILLTLSWMLVIFQMSAEPAEESAEMSLGVGLVAARILVPGFEDMSVTRQEEIARRLDHPVRKGAHMTEYAILSILFCLDFSVFGFLMNGRKVLLAVFMSGAYGGTDEFHQLFVPGRAGMFTDVLIDAGGALIGALCFSAVYVFWKKRKG